MPQRRPVALGVLDQLVRLRDPHCLAAPAEPVIENDAGRLPALAAARAVAKEEALAELDGAGFVVSGEAKRVEVLLHDVTAAEHLAMCFAGVDDRFKLRVGQHALLDQRPWKHGAVGRKRRAHRRHRRGLHEFCRMRLRAFNCDRLYGVRLVEALAKGGAALGLLPGAVDHLGHRDRQLQGALGRKGRGRLGGGRRWRRDRGGSRGVRPRKVGTRRQLLFD